jgi:menaquinone-9 beta-reductase
LVLDILASNGILFPANDSVWQGTPPLTTVPQSNASERLFVIGDAAGYVEPFTGEGMAAALEQSIAVLPLVEAGVREWRSELATAWQTHHRTEFRKRQRVCRMASVILQRRWLSNSALNLLRAFPRVAELFVGYVNRPSRPLPPNFIEKL